MTYYGMDTEDVQGSGKKVFDLEPEADAAVESVLQAYRGASDAVHHHVVREALDAYLDTHQKQHLQFPAAVRALGGNTAAGGAAIADGNSEAAAVHKGVAGEQELLLRDVNRPL